MKTGGQLFDMPVSWIVREVGGDEDGHPLLLFSKRPCPAPAHPTLQSPTAQLYRRKPGHVQRGRLLRWSARLSLAAHYSAGWRDFWSLLGNCETHWGQPALTGLVFTGQIVCVQASLSPSMDWIGQCKESREVSAT